jgi:hypothetical protein
MPGDAICITTNGFVKKNGEAVMGAGIAKEAKGFYPELPKLLGSAIKEGGNHVAVFWGLDRKMNYLDGLLIERDIISFPVKHNWWEQADTSLIRRSCEELIYWMDEGHIESALLPRPGCGNGKLDWSDVKREIEPILDDRISVVTFSKS